MWRKSNCSRRILGLAGVVVMLAAGMAAGESPAILLEKGIYAEETKGDLAGAMQIYQQVVDQVQGNRAVGAQALYRLGMCQLKKGQKDDAIASLGKLVKDFGDQKSLAAKAGEQLAKLQPAQAGGKGPVVSLPVTVREVNKPLSAYGDKTDLSTPESACAAFHRAMARGDGKAMVDQSFVKMDLDAMGASLKGADEVYRKALRDAQIVRVLTCRDRLALVVVKLQFPPGVSSSPYSGRAMVLSERGWLNLGEDRYGSAQMASDGFEAKKAKMLAFIEDMSGNLASTPALEDKYVGVMADPEVLGTRAKAIFEAIRTAEYDKFLKGESWQSFPIVGEYQTVMGYDVLVPWICRTFKDNPIVKVELDKAVRAPGHLPAVPYKLTLKDGKVMEGQLNFDFNPQTDTWYGKGGIDWHLQLAAIARPAAASGPAR